MKDFKGINWGKNQIRIEAQSVELMPTEVHLKEDGDLDDKPSLMFVLEDPRVKGIKVIGQISLTMFNEGLADIGYKIEKL